MNTNESNIPWEEQDRAVVLTNNEWNLLTSYILMTTKYRESAIAAWEKLLQEKNEDGTPTFRNAQNNIDFWHKMNFTLDTIRNKIDEVY